MAACVFPPEFFRELTRSIFYLPLDDQSRYSVGLLILVLSTLLLISLLCPPAS